MYPYSGASIPLGYPPLTAALRGVTPGVGAPASLPYTSVAGITPTALPATDPTGSIPGYGGLRSYLLAYGDPAADEAFWRGNTTQDLSGNARAWSATGVQSLPIYMTSGDGIPYADVTDASSVFLEAFANTIMLAQRFAFDQEQVTYHYEMGKGAHNPIYQQPYYRRDLEQIYAMVRHSDGGGSPAPAPAKFDYRSIRTQFEVWGWSFAVTRVPVEFLQVRDATCQGLTLQGSGVVTVTVAQECGTGLGGSRTFPVDLGPSMPVDERAEASAIGVYGNKVHVPLSRLEP